jgi:hypothetical protein
LRKRFGGKAGIGPWLPPKQPRHLLYIGESACYAI